MMVVYATPFGAVRIPLDEAFLLLRPLPLDKGYTDHIEELAEYAYQHSGRLKIAPPYGAWLKANR